MIGEMGKGGGNFRERGTDARRVHKHPDMVRWGGRKKSERGFEVAGQLLLCRDTGCIVCLRTASQANSIPAASLSHMASDVRA